MVCIPLRIQTLGCTLPRLRQTGEGFLLTFAAGASTVCLESDAGVEFSLVVVLVQADRNQLLVIIPRGIIPSAMYVLHHSCRGIISGLD